MYIGTGSGLTYITFDSSGRCEENRDEILKPNMEMFETIQNTIYIFEE